MISETPSATPAREHNLLRSLVVVLLTLTATAALVTWWFGASSSQSAPLNTTVRAGAWVIQDPPVGGHDAVANMEIVQAGTASQTDERAIAYARVPSVPALSAYVDRFVAEQLRVFDGAKVGTSSLNELNIGWEIAGASGPHLGVRMLRTMHTGAGLAHVASQTFHSNVRTGAAESSADLFTPAGKEEATALIVEALERDGKFTHVGELGAHMPVLSLATMTPGVPVLPVGAPDEILGDVVFDGEGAAIALLPQGLLTADAQGQVAVRITAELTGEILSRVGADVRQASMHALPFEGLPARPIEGDGALALVVPQSPSEPAQQDGGEAPSMLPDPNSEAGPATGLTNPAKNPAKPAKKPGDAGKDPAIPGKKRAQSDKPGTSSGSAKPGSSASAPAKAPATLPKQKPVKKVNCAKAKCIALTFDDGPGPHTSALLKTLKKEKVPGTFFLIGRNVGVYPSVVKRMAKDGHEIGNHTWSHADLRRLSASEVTSQLDKTAKAIIGSRVEGQTSCVPLMGLPTRWCTRSSRSAASPRSCGT